MSTLANPISAEVLPGGTRDASFMRAVEDHLRAAVSGRDEGAPGLVLDASSTLVLAPGAKRLRPRLIMLIAADMGAPDAGAQRVAAAAELMHAASLLHDDVVDEGQLRRGLPTANARWGNAAAVLAGDWLLTQSLRQLGRLPAPLTATAIATAAEMTAAAIREIEARGRTDLALRDWRRIAEGKTGALFAWCGRAAALLAGREDAAGPLDAFGRHLGVAFQMADDLRDLCDHEAGKDRFSDIRSKTPSSVLVLAMERSPALRVRIERAWAEPAPAEPLIEEIGAAVIGEGAMAAALALVDHEIATAQAAARTTMSRAGAADLARFGQQLLQGLR